ncbi:MAG: hypothetical protein RQ982_01240 [Gammaproteobacteria bacterium]|nr:hypothetical protein [Gammaproteobacteria bacterium]
MHKIKQILTAITFTLFTCLVTMSSSVLAATPDGETPANEGVCNELQGGTPGLYGLCVAYCEAQDLDIVGDKETPNNKILANYRKKMAVGDPDMPCIQIPCPCWSDAELAAITTPTDCATTATTGVIRSLTQFASIETTRPTCRFTDRNTTPPISRRFADEAAISLEAAQTCHAQIVAACTSLGL